MQRLTLDEKAISWIYYKLSNLFRINYCIAWNFRGRNFHKLVKGTILVEKTFTDCSLLPCQRTPHPQISWRKLLHLATKLQNSQKFSPSKVCYTVHFCHTFTWKVPNLAVVGCWFSCVGAAVSLGPWAEAAADRWNEKETQFLPHPEKLHLKKVESGPRSWGKTTTKAVQLHFCSVSIIPNLSLVTLNQWLNNQDG